ncbi:ImmA/IrrE family metallo-endopeptidase [Paucilactobacillus sp. N302-9]
MDSIITYLLNFAYDNRIGYVWEDRLSSDTPSAANNNTKTIVINAKWHNQKELPFQIAHEIGHILNNDEGVLYYSSSSSESKIESNANATAINILIDYCTQTEIENANVYQFMEQFGIPGNLEYLVVDRLNARYSI